MTLVEMMLGMGLLTFLMWGFFSLVESSVRETSSMSAEQATFQRNQIALNQVRRELRQSGFVTVDGTDYPEFFPDNSVGGLYDEFDHEDPVDRGAAEPVAVDLVYRVPADDDGDGWPDIEGTGPAWSNEIRCLALVPMLDGSNNLVRMSTTGPTVTLARGLGRFLVEDPGDTGWTIPLSAVRVTLEHDLHDDRSATPVVGTEVMILGNGGNAN